jgi:hypothetical protein
VTGSLVRPFNDPLTFIGYAWCNATLPNSSATSAPPKPAPRWFQVGLMLGWGVVLAMSIGGAVWHVVTG